MLPLPSAADLKEKFDLGRPGADQLRLCVGTTVRLAAAHGRSGPPGSVRYDPAILLHCVSAACLSEAMGIFAAAVRQACLALLTAALTFALLVVI